MEVDEYVCHLKECDERPTVRPGNPCVKSIAEGDRQEQTHPRRSADTDHEKFSEDLRCCHGSPV